VTWDEDVELWDETTHQRVNIFNGHTGYITDCEFSPTASVLLSASRDKTVKLWDLTSGTRIATISGHTRGMFSTWDWIVFHATYKCVTIFVVLT
jgi:WD40 repeat protein